MIHQAELKLGEPKLRTEWVDSKSYRRPAVILLKGQRIKIPSKGLIFIHIY